MNKGLTISLKILLSSPKLFSRPATQQSISKIPSLGSQVDGAQILGILHRFRVSVCGSSARHSSALSGLFHAS
jgi:hypothetical protein